MKKLLLLLLLVSGNAWASNKQNICYVPKGCKVQNFHFGSGGDHTPFNLSEIVCDFPNGTQAQYMTKSNIRWSGILGLNRFWIAPKVIFKEHSEDNLECKYEDLET